jgi:phosphopantetheinyl transferase
MSYDCHSERLAEGLVLWTAPTAWSGPFHSPPGPPPPWLSAAERAEWQTFRCRKRADEFAAGRRLLRHALAAGGLQSDELIISRDRFRAPRIDLPRAAPSFSLSHCGAFTGVGWTVALLGPPGSRLGVDAEPLLPALAANVVALIAAGAEGSGLAAGGPADRLRAWVVKECVQKTLGLGMHLDPRRVDARDNPIRIGGRAIAMRVMERHGLLIAVGISLPPPILTASRRPTHATTTRDLQPRPGAGSAGRRELARARSDGPPGAGLLPRRPRRGGRAGRPGRRSQDA